MISKLTLKFGTGPGQEPLSFTPGPLTIFVGPNNSGKSQLLRDIARYVTTSGARGSPILRRVRRRIPRGPVRAEILAQIRKDLELFIGSETDPVQVPASSPEVRDLAQVLAPVLAIAGFADLARRRLSTRRLAKFLRVPFGPEEITPTDVDKNLALARGLFTWLAQQRKEGGLDRALLQLLRMQILSLESDASLLASATLLLDGKGRLDSVRPTAASQFRHRDGNCLTNLLKNEKARAELRRIVHDAFDLYPVIDATDPRGTFLKLSKKEPSGLVERRTDDQALRFFDRAKDIQEYSDGVKSFTGLVAAVLSDHYQLMLIDEPEAFLHPSLVRQLGFELHRLARRRKGHVIAATHSAEFVTGCLQAGHEVNIIRLTYRNRKATATARLLPRALLQEMMREPLLRSAGILSALSHRGAVVCEGDSDRAFYQEIDDRLRGEEKGLEGCVFINAHNKQTVYKVLRPIHDMGIRVAAILDFDLIGKEDDYRDILEAVGARQLVSSIGPAKSTLFKAFCEMVPDADLKGSTEQERKKERDDRARALIKRQGLRALSPEMQKAARLQFIDPLAAYGIFVVPVGDLESWLNLVRPGEVRSKNEWITTTLERMGSDPKQESYLRPPKPPRDDDVWAFMRRIARWFSSE